MNADFGEAATLAESIHAELEKLGAGEERIRKICAEAGLVVDLSASSIITGALNKLRAIAADLRRLEAVNRPLVWTPGSRVH